MRTFIITLVLLPGLALATEISEMTVETVKSAGYTLELDVDLAGVESDTRLFEIPGALELLVREAGKDPALAQYDRFGGNLIETRAPFR